MIKKKNIGIELFRIVSMYMIVVIHILVKGGVIEQSKGLATNLCTWIMYSLVICCVNCYGLISGFVGYKPKSGGVSYRVSEYINLWLSVVFWGIAMLVVLKLTGIGNIGKKDFIEAMLPVTRDQYWYFTAYTGVFLVRPFINRIIDSLEEREALKCCVIFGMISLYATLAQNLGGDPFKLEEGYSVVWLVLLYFVGGVIRKFEWYRKLNGHGSKLAIALLGCVCFNTLWKYAVGNMTYRFLGFVWGERMFVSYVSPIVVIESLCLLLLFSNMMLSKITTKIVNFFAPAAFGVYLIHVQHQVARVLIKDQFRWIAQYPALQAIVLILGISLAIIICSMLMEKIRLWAWDLLGIKQALYKVEQRICKRSRL